MNRQDLKAACLEMLDQVAIEHPAGHQGKLAARYVLRSQAGDRIELMFEKGEKVSANLWIERRYAEALASEGIICREYPAASLFAKKGAEGKKTYGRHSALKPMRSLANSDLLRFTIERVSQLQSILDHLRTERV
ncbi:hypothetical protein IT41_06565 [Paracoccus halophilus]|uniref:Uncharacterized protein n=1 Tax=Paracoccus halophilus TaxID=376733 RepID=A0A099F5K4_9RHOB|nr:hypothetical protein IT41_06565 [Paracoccus halophilus]